MDIRSRSQISIPSRHSKFLPLHRLFSLFRDQALKFNEARAYMPIFSLSVIFLSTFILSQITTDRHRRLGNEQCDYILLHYRKELKTKLTELTLRKRQL